MLFCKKEPDCPVRLCLFFRKVINHFKTCQSVTCKVCIVNRKKFSKIGLGHFGKGKTGSPLCRAELSYRKQYKRAAARGVFNSAPVPPRIHGLVPTAAQLVHEE